MASGKIDIVLEIYDAVNNTLTISGISAETASKYSYFASELYTYIKNSPTLQTAFEGSKAIYEMNAGAKASVVAARLASNATAMNSLGAAGKLATLSKVSAGGAISAFVDYFAGVAKALKIEMNECAIAITKVMLDVLTTIALMESVLGIWAALLQALATGADTKEMIQACLVD
jgi:hypothetical protein